VVRWQQVCGGKSGCGSAGACVSLCKQWLSRAGSAAVVCLTQVRLARMQQMEGTAVCGGSVHT
jgi:hypothetical protein